MRRENKIVELLEKQFWTVDMMGTIGAEPGEQYAFSWSGGRFAGCIRVTGALVEEIPQVAVSALCCDEFLLVRCVHNHRDIGCREIAELGDLANAGLRCRYKGVLHPVGLVDVVVLDSDGGWMSVDLFLEQCRGTVRRDEKIRSGIEDRLRPHRHSQPPERRMRIPYSHIDIILEATRAAAKYLDPPPRAKCRSRRRPWRRQ